MKRGIVNTLIAGYLSVLVYGLFCHALYYKINQHPAMYFIVWDMYCGWSGYETRLHVIGEGESGQYYELSPGPWGTIIPYGNIERQHYDHTGMHSVRLGLNTLRQTDHEPMTRLLVIEEAWPRKYNLTDKLWSQRYSEPKEPHSYYQLRSVYTPDGQLLQQQPAFLARIGHEAIMSNPRLLADMKKGRAFYAVQPNVSGQVTPASYELPTPAAQ